MKLYHITDTKSKGSIKAKGLLVSSTKCEDTKTINKHLGKLQFNRNKCIFLSPYKPKKSKNIAVFEVDSSNIPLKSYAADRAPLDALINALKVGLSISEYKERYIDSIIPYSDYLKYKDSYDEDYDVEIIVTKSIEPKYLKEI